MLAVLGSVPRAFIFFREYCEEIFEEKLPMTPILLPPELPIVVAPDPCDPPEFYATNDDFFFPYPAGLPLEIFLESEIMRFDSLAELFWFSPLLDML